MQSLQKIEPIECPQLRPLADAQCDAAILQLMEDDAHRRVLRSLDLDAIPADPAERAQYAIHMADELPKELPELFALYKETRDSLHVRSLREIQYAASGLTMKAGALERIAVRAAATPDNMRAALRLSRQAVTQYAGLLAGAKTLAAHGVVAMQDEQLSALLERPSGPLAALYDAAVAQARQERERNVAGQTLMARERMAA